MSRKTTQNGRSDKGPPFNQLFHFVIDSAAYRSLSPLSQALLTHVLRRYNGENNGALGLGHREAATLCNVNKDTIKRAFDELQTKGFISASRKGGFNMKDPTTRRASEWRLTWKPAQWIGLGATFDFKQWKQDDI